MIRNISETTSEVNALLFSCNHQSGLSASLSFSFLITLKRCWMFLLRTGFKPVICDNGLTPFLMTKQHTILLLHSVFTLRELGVFRNSVGAGVLVDMAGLANNPHGCGAEAEMPRKAGSWHSRTEMSPGQHKDTTSAGNKPWSRAIGFAARCNLRCTEEEFTNSQTARGWE